MLLLDTSIAVHLRDQEETTARRLAERSLAASISLITLVELEGGIAANPAHATDRRAALMVLLKRVIVLPFNQDVVDVYGRIIRTAGFSRPRILDRLIAATAIVNDIPLATINGPDFRDVPGLKLEVWAAPAQ